MKNIVWDWDVEEMHNGRPHWYVLNNGNFGRDKVYNVLTHPYILELCAETGKHARFKHFNERLQSLCLSEFAGRAQYEIGFGDKFPCIASDEVGRLTDEVNKHPDRLTFDVDVRDYTSANVYDQLFMNWDAFAHYVFKNRVAIVQAAKDRFNEFVAKLAAEKASKSE